jgi:outer membrane protein assembly factor BamE (lipoprotein component of BamABCDE complex)
MSKRFGVQVTNRPLDEQFGHSWRRRGRCAVAGFLLAAMGLALVACDTPVRIRGHVADPESIEAIKAGEYTQDDVLALLGTPSTVSTFDERKWYYIGHKWTKFAFQHPEIIERSVLVLSFDDTGYVSNKQIFSLADGREIEPIDRETPTEGRDFTVMQQLLGNLGRLPGSGTSATLPDLPGP